MGRHSAPEDDDGDLLLEEPPRPQPGHRARHASPTDTDDADAPADPAAQVVDTDVIEPELVARGSRDSAGTVVDAEVVEDDVRLELAARAAPAEPAPVVEKQRPGRADLALLRTNSSVRARCVAGLLLPFVLYTVVLVVIGRLDAYLFWIWIPAIVGGVLFGAQLDAGHKAAVPRE